MSAKTASPRLVNLLFMIASLVLMAISLPLMMGKIGPNGLYGFRTAKTMSDPAIWYPINALAGRNMVIACAIMLLTTLLIFAGGKKLTTNQTAYINLAVLTVALGGAIAHAAVVLSSM